MSIIFSLSNLPEETDVKNLIRRSVLDGSLPPEVAGFISTLIDNGECGCCGCSSGAETPKDGNSSDDNPKMEDPSFFGGRNSSSRMNKITIEGLSLEFKLESFSLEFDSSSEY